MSDEKELKVNGVALKTLVRAAETPVVGQGVKNQLLSQMGLDALFELDLRTLGEPEPIASPMPPVD
jgi:hypothetical protein